MSKSKHTPRHPQDWFLTRIGKKVVRTCGLDKCACAECAKARTEGILIRDKQHAQYLLQIQNEAGFRYTTFKPK